MCAVCTFNKNNLKNLALKLRNIFFQKCDSAQPSGPSNEHFTYTISYLVDSKHLAV